MKPLTLTEWWRNPDKYPHLRNPWVIHVVPTGKAEVYVHRQMADKSVLTIASINSLKGFGAAWHLYRTFCRDIPTIAEQIINPALDAWLARIGWSQVWYDGLGIPTRVNPAFMTAFPGAGEAHSAASAVYRARHSAQPGNAP